MGEAHCVHAGGRPSKPNRGALSRPIADAQTDAQLEPASGRPASTGQHRLALDELSVLRLMIALMGGRSVMQPLNSLCTDNTPCTLISGALLTAAKDST